MLHKALCTLWMLKQVIHTHTALPVLCPFILMSLAVTQLLNLPSFILGLTSFAWPHSTMLTLVSDEYIISHLSPLFRNTMTA